jgi:hypothetical protein
MFPKLASWKNISQEPRKIFGIRFRENVRLFIGEQYPKAKTNIRRQNVILKKT